MIWWAKGIKKCVGFKLLGTFFYFYSVSSCVSISTFDSVVGVPVGITVYAVGLKMRLLTARIKKC